MEDYKTFLVRQLVIKLASLVIFTYGQLLIKGIITSNPAMENLVTDIKNTTDDLVGL